MARAGQEEQLATWWLIAGGEVEESVAKPLTLDLCGDKGGALAVFSFQEEAQMYLQVEALEGSWQVEEVEARQLASVLLWGSCSQVKWLALDPMPPRSVSCKVNHLVCASRQHFLDVLVGNSDDAATVGSRVRS